MGRGRIILVAAVVGVMIALMTGAAEPARWTEARWNFHDDLGTLPLFVIAGIGLLIALRQR